jgi:hypothetical protein
MRDGGKGDSQRPLVVPMQEFDNNWDAIFNKPNPLADKMIKQIEDHLREQPHIQLED